MEFDSFVCEGREASILLHLIYMENKRDPLFPECYSSVPTVMFGIGNSVLTRETGLKFTYFDEGEYYFDILDNQKFMLAKIKYGF